MLNTFQYYKSSTFPLSFSGKKKDRTLSLKLHKSELEYKFAKKRNDNEKKETALSEISNLLIENCDKNKYNEVHSFFKSVIAESGVNAALEGRVKSKASMKNKLQRKLNSFNDVNKAISNIPDVIGVSCIMEDSSNKSLNNFLNSLAKGLDKNNKIALVDVANYHGVGIQPYLNEEMLNNFLNKLKNRPKVQENNIKKSGYTAVHLNFEMRSENDRSIPIELQLRGKEVQNIYKKEHGIYAVRQGKLDELPENVSEKVKELEQEQYKNYLLYIGQNYKFCRRNEKGEKLLSKPELPHTVPKVLDLEQIQP